MNFKDFINDDAQDLVFKINKNNLPYTNGNTALGDIIEDYRAGCSICMVGDANNFRTNLNTLLKNDEINLRELKIVDEFIIKSTFTSLWIYKNKNNFEKIKKI
jgi:hypothetical protein